jgi:5'-nucleotidase
VKPVKGLGYAVDGTPCDCVFLACEQLLRAAPPDLLVSGINAGGNLGADVLYSGTVAVAMEGTLRGIPSIAMSLVGTHDLDFSEAARFLGALAPEVIRRGLPEGILLNVNVPKRPATPRRYRVTTLGRHTYADVIDAREDPRRRPYYWIAGRWDGYDPIEGSDCVAIGEGEISVTPLHFGFGAQEHADGLREWGLEGFEKTPR